MIPLFKYKYTCIVDTVYALSIYLLYTDDETCDKTMFIVGPGIPRSVVDRLPHKIYLQGKNLSSDEECLKFRRRSIITWPFRRFTKLFAQDHVWLFNAIIGTMPYTYIEDCPEVYSKCHNLIMQEPLKVSGFRWYFWAFRKHGTTYRQPLGHNRQCINRIITSERDVNSPYLKGRKYTLLDYKKTWLDSSETKKKIIKDIYSISDKQIEQLKLAQTIVFTQPLTTDCGLTEQEQVEIYKPYIEKYIHQGIIIKPHPRDNVDYCKYYPEISMIDSKAPMQLLEAFDLNVKYAITVCSTAVSCLEGKADIIWIGSDIDNRLVEKFGHQTNPFSK